MKSDTADHSILLVDDNEPGRYATASDLRQAGFAVTEAATGEEALNRVADNPDLIVLDINLPDISGFEVCRKVKENPATAHIPVLHLSAKYLDNGAKVKGLNIGADAYLTQPVEPPVLLATINALLRMKRAEQTLQESEDLYRDLVEHSRALICTHDLDGRILSANEWASEVLGIDRARLLEKNIRDILAPEGKDQCEAYLEALRKDGAAEGLMRIRTVSGEQRLWQYHNTVRSEGVRIPIVRGIAFDITESKKVEASLKKSEQLLKDSQAISKVGGWEYDVKHKRITWTDEVYRIYGVEKDYDPNDIEKDIRFYFEEDRQVIEQAFLNAVNKGLPYDLELRLKAADGSQKWVRTSGKAVVQGCKVTKVIGNIMDITDRKRTDEALRQSKNRLNRALENIPDVVVIYDKDLKIQYINAATRRVTGRPVSDFIGKREEEVWPPEVYQVYMPMLQESFNTGEVRSLDTELTFSNNDIRSLRITCVPLIDKKGAVREVMGITNDYTERKQAEEKIAEQLHELQRWHNVMLDREDRIFELKREVNELLARGGQPPQYPSAVEILEKQPWVERGKG